MLGRVHLCRPQKQPVECPVDGAGVKLAAVTKGVTKTEVLSDVPFERFRLALDEPEPTSFLKAPWSIVGDNLRENGGCGKRVTVMARRNC